VKSDKNLIIMRGVPGSGKSTKAKKISNGSGLIFSTDDFFIVKGEYIYDPKMIGQYHEQNFERTLKAMKEATPLIIIDNTNVKLWEMKKYVEAAD
jgi:predicted kinase